jgi:precorrin-6A/cobalt-precorrin-6A reductase
LNRAARAGPVLVLGGTAEARTIADALHREGIAVVLSLAGRTADPRLPAGQSRVRGFGGSEGLENWLKEHECTAVVDATHPFAVRISQSAVSACASAAVPLVRLHRPGWTEQQGDRWFWVDDMQSAAELVPRLGTRVLLSIGRRRLDAFAAVSEAWFLVRCVDPPDSPLPINHAMLLARGPFTLKEELDLIQQHRIDLIVTRDSGGSSTEAKLIAARTLGLPVIVIRRPRPPEAPTVNCVSQAIQWARVVTSETTHA